jgi:hypothetical protein
MSSDANSVPAENAHANTKAGLAAPDAADPVSLTLCARTSCAVVRKAFGSETGPAERAPRTQIGAALAPVVPAVAATIAVAGAGHGALLDHA